MYKAFATPQRANVKSSDSYIRNLKKHAHEDMKARIRGEMPIELVHLLAVLTVRKFPCDLPPFHTYKLSSDPSVVFMKFIDVMSKAYQKDFLSTKEMIHLLLELRSHTYDTEEFDPELRSAVYVLNQKVYEVYTQGDASHEET